jgi:APA family basic amino acid/polyamine antiporter
MPEVPPAALLGALVVLLWTYDGWSDVTLVSGELEKPGRDLGRAVLGGTAILVALYVLVQLSVGALLDPATAASSERVVADAVQSGLGARAGKLVALLVVVCTFGSINGTVLTASRLGYAMARDHKFPAWFGAIHPRWGTPARSVAGLVAASLVYVTSAGFLNLLAFFSFSVWIFYGLTAVALLLLRRRRVGEPVPWRAPGGVLPPAVVLATAVAMTVSLMLQDPKRSLAGLGLLLLGFPAYALFRRYGGDRVPV